MVSTVASGDTSAYVGISDITMMFSVGDILGLNPFMRKVLANAAGAAHGMAQVEVDARARGAKGDKPLIGISNLGVLTQGHAARASSCFGERGYETIVFHAVGTGGRAMELMMQQGIIGAVFDYAMGEISDELFHGLRAGGQERLTVAGALGLPQVMCPAASSTSASWCRRRTSCPTAGRTTRTSGTTRSCSRRASTQELRMVRARGRQAPRSPRAATPC